MSAAVQPLGTVTLVFTDIEGSTRLLADLGESRYLDALSDHREAVREAFGRYGGYEVGTEGDSFFYAFPSATGAVRAAAEALTALEGGPIAVRVGIHTGEPVLDGVDYVGLDVHTAARIMAAGHGGQILLSESTRELLDESFTLVDLGEHRLKDLSGPWRLYQLGAGPFPPLRTLHRTNLPVPATAFVGRGDDLDELRTFLQGGVRLLTLTGPGGVGKTRLALRAAADAADAFPDGVWWVPLASLKDPGLILSSVALALGVREQAGRALEETLVDVLSPGRTLLLLDNLEQLLPGAAAPVATLRNAGGATIVVTSRERLRLEGEQAYAVAPLAATDAVELFAARTAALGVDSEDAVAVAELCARLDNLPLAVELAAAWAGLLAPAEMLERLGGRLDRLRGGRDSDPRQQTLRDTIAWSHDLLDQGERELFAHLAVFSGGGTLDAVEALCDADLDVLVSLLDKSLVRRTRDRVWMLETIRDFAGEQLDTDPDAAALRDLHAAHYLAFARAADREVRGSGQADALKRLEAERDNLRVALGRLLGRDPTTALELAAALWGFWFRRGHFQEGREMLVAALEGVGLEPTEARASALVGAGLLASDRGDRRESFGLLREGLACGRVAGSTRIEVLALSHLADDAELDREERIRLGKEAIALASASGDRWLLGDATGSHGLTMLMLGETESGIELTEEAVRLCRETGDVSSTAIWLSNLASNAILAGDTGEARARLDEALELVRGIDGRWIPMITVNLGWVELLDGDLDAACARFEEGAALARGLGVRAIVADAIWGFAQVAAAAGGPVHAARLAGAASALGRPAGFDPTSNMITRCVEDAREALGERAWQKAWDEGNELDLDAALALAFAVAEIRDPAV